MKNRVVVACAWGAWVGAVAACLLAGSWFVDVAVSLLTLPFGMGIGFWAGRIVGRDEGRSGVMLKRSALLRRFRR